VRPRPRRGPLLLAGRAVVLRVRMRLGGRDVVLVQGLLDSGGTSFREAATKSPSKENARAE
jgi:hypothetical protein